MAKQRLQVSSGLQPVPLRPQASPVDTFAQPNAGSKLGQLAEALSGLAPSIARYSDVVAEQQNAKQQQAGVLAAQKAQEEGKTYREAIQQGVIRPDQSPWFRMGAQETFGRVTARKYVGDFLASEEYFSVADSTDPRDFDKAEQAFRKRWGEENVGAQEPDQHYQLAFNNQAEATLFGIRENFAEQAGSRLVKLTGEAYHAEVFQTALDAAGQHLTAQQTADRIILARERQFVAGHTNRALLNQITASAIVSAAKRLNDPTILEVMDHIKLGTGTLAGTSYGSKGIEEAGNAIAAETQRAYTWAHEKAAIDQKAATESVISDVTKALNDAPDPGAVDLKKFRERMQQADPEKVSMIFQIQDAYSNHQYTDDPNVRMQLFTGIQTIGPGEAGYVTINDVARAFAAHSISTETYRALVNDIQERDKDGGNRGSKFLNDDGLKYGQRIVRSLFVSEFGFEGPEMRQRAAQAELEFTARYLTWRRGAGIDPSPTEVNNFVNEQSQSIVLGPNSKASQSGARDFAKIPKANTGPQVPDWHKSVVTDPSWINMLEQQAGELRSQKRNAFDPFIIGILKYAGVKPDPKEIEEFIATQKRLAASAPLPQ